MFLINAFYLDRVDNIALDAVAYREGDLGVSDPSPPEIPKISVESSNT